MNVVTLILRWPGILIGVLFMVAVLTACSDSTGSTPPTNGDSGAWDEYEAFCSEAAQKELDDNEDYTNEEVSTFYAGLVERMESIDPPVEIADWHDKVLAGWTAVKRLIDSEPQDAIFNPLMLFSDSEILSLFGEVEEAFNEIPADVRERLAAAGCSDDADSQATGAGESDTPQPDSTATADSGRTSTGQAFLPACEPRAKDEAALVAFYKATDGPNWGNNTNWLTDAPLSDWAGVSAITTTENGRVVGECVYSLLLAVNRLSGEIPAELGNLPNLEWLWLAVNRLSGGIPAELGNLLNLEWLDLAVNRLSGGIPAELGNLLNLEWLDLAVNRLSGGIPAELGNLLNLEWLDLAVNQLSGGIPAELGNLLNLEWLDLAVNRLSGGIPAELGNLLNLEWLDLAVNRLSGGIPAELGNLLNLEWLDLAVNRLSGGIPAELGNLLNLVLDGNRLTERVLRPGGANPQYAWEGSTIRVSWDAVDGADYYKVYHEDFFDGACSLGSDGRPSFCEELATDVTGTTYVHTNPSLSENYYWVVSCNSDGCSHIDKKYPAQLIGPTPSGAEPSTQPGAVYSTPTPRATRAPTQTPAPSDTPTPVPTPTQTRTPSDTPTPEPTPTQTPEPSTTPTPGPFPPPLPTFAMPMRTRRYALLGTRWLVPTTTTSTMTTSLIRVVG